MSTLEKARKILSRGDLKAFDELLQSSKQAKDLFINWKDLGRFTPHENLAYMKKINNIFDMLDELTGLQGRINWMNREVPIGRLLEGIDEETLEYYLEILSQFISVTVSVFRDMLDFIEFGLVNKLDRAQSVLYRYLTKIREIVSDYSNLVSQ